MQKIFLSLVIIVASLQCIAQDMLKNIENFAAKFSPERAYLHFDKHAYGQGETIWFKAYVMNEIAPATESKSFYVDWIDDKGKLLQHSPAPLIEGVTNGQFEIPGGYKGKTIQVRAYTKWMLNFDTSFLFYKTIPILNKDSLLAAQKIIINTDVDFFPEGGDMIAGVDNKIAFKATDQWGKPVKIKGVVIDDAGKVVDSVRTLHDGMGFFTINPVVGKTYKVKWKDDKKTERVTALPASKQNGVALAVMVMGDKRNFQVSVPKSYAGELDSVKIIGTMFQHTIFSLAKKVDDKPITGSIPIANLPYGVLTITVFDKQWKPLAERITYINNNMLYTATPTMEVQHWGLSHRARNEIIITLPDAGASSMSVSVTDKAIGADSSENIISGLMLTSELKGRVHNPAYYFKNAGNAVQQHLDLVMLTNGWRRFNWSKIKTGNFNKPAYSKDTAYLSLSGNIMGVVPGTVPAGSPIIVMLKQKNAEGQMLMVPLQRDGSFNDPNAIIFDSARLYYGFQDKSLKGSLVTFMPYKLRMPAVDGTRFGKIFPDTTGMGYLWAMSNEAYTNAERLKFKELESVTVRAKSKPVIQQLDEKYTSGLFTGDGVQLDVLNDPFAKSAIDIFSYLQGKVAGLQISGQGANASLSWRGGAPQLYIDEMPADINFVSSINVNDVAYIKAFRPPFMGGFNGSNGAVAIYTRRGGDAQPDDTKKGLSGAVVEGYAAIKEFYSPKYYSKDVPPNADRDVRSTIYWNPNAAVDAQKKQVLLSFYNNDVTDAFRVVIEGMTVDGKLIHYETTME